MGKRLVYEIAGMTFATQAALAQYIRALVAAYGNEERVRPEDVAFVLALLARHPSAAQKIGAGVREVLIRQNPVYPAQRGFWLVRHDGSGTDFSWTECLRATPHAQRFLRALRAAIEPETQAYRHAFFAARNNAPYPCPYTGELVTLRGAHVDHQAPLTFRALVQQFVASEGLDVAQVKVNGQATDNVWQDTLDDLALAQSWIEYHRTHARLQVVSRTANLSILKKRTEE